MIEERTFTDKVALSYTKDAVEDLVLRAELMGLSMLGESISIHQDASVQTMCTDGRIIRVCPAWLETNGSRGNAFDLLHEWLHCFLNHVARLGDRDPKIWNIACDMVVVRMASEILSRPGDHWPPPSDGVIPPPWAADLSAEEIYDKLIENRALMPRPVTGKGELQMSADFDYKGAGSYTESEEQDFHQKFTQELAQAQLIMQMSTGKTTEERYGATVASRLREVLRGTVPWSRLFRGNLIDAVTQQFATWAPPRRKHYPTLIMPSYHSYLERKLFLGIDVSASVGQDMMKMFISNAMPAAMRAKETIIVTFDQVIREVVVTKRPRAILDQVKFLTGAHRRTDVRPVFDLVNKYRPSGVAIMTDAYLYYPEKPYKQTLWVVPKGAGTPPWGKIYTMERAW